MESESKKLRKAGAHSVLVVGHLGNDCNTTNQYGKWTKDTPQEPCGVSDDEATKLIEGLPEGTIDGLIQGHRHKFAHHFINGKSTLTQECPIWGPSTAATTSTCCT